MAESLLFRHHWRLCTRISSCLFNHAVSLPQLTRHVALTVEINTFTITSIEILHQPSVGVSVKVLQHWISCTKFWLKKGNHFGNDMKMRSLIFVSWYVRCLTMLLTWTININFVAKQKGNLGEVDVHSSIIMVARWLFDIVESSVDLLVSIEMMY
jgi:hypothetical protein